MIIANALQSLFKNAVADCVFLGSLKQDTKIQFWYGDQKELIQWIKERRNLVNYPLIWYVLNDYTEFDGWYSTNASLVLMQDTQLQKLNDWRSSNSYAGILEPVKDVVIEKLTTNGFVQILGNFEDRFTFRAIPNYGVDLDSPNAESNDFSRKTKKNTESINIDIVDCLTIDFKLKIKAKCLIKCNY